MSSPKIGKKVYEDHMEAVRNAPPDEPHVTDELPPTVVNDPEEAVTFLLSFLPRNVVEVFEEAQRGMDIPKWHIMLGFIMRSFDQMILQAAIYSPYLLANWTKKAQADAPRICEHCNLPFKADYHDARFCCDRCYFLKVDTMGHAAGCPAMTERTNG